MIYIKQNFMNYTLVCLACAEMMLQANNAASVRYAEQVGG